MKKLIRKIIFLGLAVISIFNLTACGKNNVSGENDNEKTVNAVSNNGQQSSEGRYLESVIDTTGFEDGYDVLSYANAQEVLVFKISSEGIGRKYSQSEASEWNMSELKWLNGAYDAQSEWINCICVGEDGNEYALTGGGGSFKVIKRLSESEGKLIDIGGEVPGGIGVSKSEKIVLVYDEHINVYDSDGNLEYELESGSNESQVKTTFAVKEDKLVTMDLNKDGFIIYNLNDGTVEQEFAFEFQKDEDSVFAFDNEFDVYIADSKGVHYIDMQLGEAIDLIAAEGNKLSTSFACNMSVVDKNNIYIKFYDDEFCKYTYDENAKAAEEVLNIYGLYEDKQIRETIVRFQREYPEYEVKYTVANKDSSVTATDNIKALNTEILNGNGADILVLDGLLADSYIEKGILEDISDVVKEAGVIENIAVNYETDKKIYNIPTKIGIPVMAGTEEYKEKITTINGLKSIVDEGLVKDCFKEIPSESVLLTVFVDMYSEELFDEDKKLNKENMEMLLNLVKNIYEESASTDAREIPSEIQSIIDSSYQKWIEFNYNVDLFVPWALGETKMGAFSEIADVPMFNIAVADYMNTEFESINNKYFPYGVVGVNSSSKNIDAAKKFVNQLLLAEGVDYDTIIGFPVSKSALEGLKTSTNDNVVGSINFNDGKSLEVNWPSSEKLEKISALIKSVNNPVKTEKVVVEMIKSEADAVFAGTKNAKEAVQSIENKVNTYLAE